jgi:hypothetical protein
MDDINKKVDIQVEVSLGRIDATGNGKRDNLVTVEVKTEIVWGKQKRLDVNLREVTNYRTLSIVGNIWNASRTDTLSWGQNYDEIAEALRGSDDAQSLVEIWKRWHCNDMNAGTAKQQAALSQLDSLLNWRKFSGEPLHNPIGLVVAGMKAKEQELDTVDNYPRLLYKIASSVLDPFGQRYDVTKMYELIANVFMGFTEDRYKLQGMFLGALNLNPQNGYVYGSAWLVEKIPKEILDRLGAALSRLDTGEAGEPGDGVLPEMAARVTGPFRVTNPKSKWFGSSHWVLKLGEVGEENMEFDYYTGPAITGKPPVQDILHCLFQDAWYVEMETEEFATEMGYESYDEAERVLEEIRENTTNLVRALGMVEFKRLKEVYSDYD